MESSTDAILALGSDPTRPLLTYVDDATGERVDLTATELGTWAARTASLLIDDCGLAPGSHVAVLLPPHWQTAAVLLGAWAAGMSVGARGWATAGLPPVGAAADVPVDATFVSAARLRSWLEDVPDAPHRFVLGLGSAEPVPEDYRDFVDSLPVVDSATPPEVVIGPRAAASPDGTTYRQWGQVAAWMAESAGIRRGDRVLVDAAEHEHPAKWLLGPLSVGASVVLCAHLDPARVAARVAADGITRVL
jgi:uncharacterized protein (TIGR03089 family)